MEEKFLEKQIKMKINNIDINITKTNKYSNVIFNVYFLQNFSDNWKYLTYIGEVISKCNNKFTTTEAQCQEMYRLYGSIIFASKVANYKTMGIKFTVDCLNEKIVNDNSLYDECFSSLKNMIYNPHTHVNKNGEIEFDLKDFNEAKNNCLNELVNQANDKRKYSNMRFLKKMGSKDSFPLILFQTISDVKRAKSVDAYNFYQDLINNSRVVISAVGDIDEDVINRFVKTIDVKSRDIELEYEDNVVVQNPVRKRITEKADIKQAHIYLGYRTDIVYRSDLYPAYILFSIMFGELPSSTLFSKIREEQGLCYSVYSSVYPIRNFFYIYAGVENKNIDIAIKSIKKELESYQRGLILDSSDRSNYEELLEASKKELKNEYINSLDSQSSILLNGMKDVIAKRRSMKELYEDSLKVTLEDIVIASKHLYFDTTYVLRGEIGDENGN